MLKDWRDDSLFKPASASCASYLKRVISDVSDDLTDGCRRLEELGLLQLKFQKNKTMQTEVAVRLEEALCNARG